MKTNKQPTTDVIVRPRQAEVVPHAPGEFAVLHSQPELERALNLIQSNLGKQTFDPRDIARIKSPAGGGRELQVDGGESEPDLVRELEGVVVAQRTARSYWEKPYGSGDGKTPPDCASTDGLVGVGKPGGDCHKCQFREFGPNGKAPKCSEKRQLLVLLQGQFLPHFFDVPSASVKNWDTHTLKLLYARPPVEYYQIVTRIFTEKSKSQGGIDYYKVQFSQGRRLTPEEARRAEPYHRIMRELLTPMTVEAAAYEVEEAEEATEETPF